MNEFDKVFQQLESSDYPATCNECGAEGTNASLEEHVCAGETTKLDPKQKCDSCGFTRDAHWGVHPIVEGRCTGFYVASGNEPPAPRAGESDWLDEEEFYDLMQEYRHANITDQSEVCARYNEVRSYIRNQHSTLLAQRDRLLVLLRATMKIVADRMSSGRMLTTRGEAAAIWDEYNAAITTIEQEGKS